MKLRWLAMIVCTLSILASCSSKPRRTHHEDDDDDGPTRPRSHSAESLCKKLKDLRDKEKKDDQKSEDDRKKQLDDCIKEGEKEKVDHPAKFECLAACADKDSWADFVSCSSLCKATTSSTEPSAKPVAGTTDDFVKAYCDCKNETKCLTDAAMKYGDALAKTPLTPDQSKRIADCTMAASTPARSTDDYVKAYCDCRNETKCLTDNAMKYSDVLAKTPLTADQSKKIADCTIAAADMPSAKPPSK